MNDVIMLIIMLYCDDFQVLYIDLKNA